MRGFNDFVYSIVGRAGRGGAGRGRGGKTSRFRVMFGEGKGVGWCTRSRTAHGRFHALCRGFRIGWERTGFAR